jgi:LPS-assembly lipoprotein
MSSSETRTAPSPRSAGRAALLGAALLGAALAGGCFRPLYAESTTSVTGGSVKTALRSVELPEIKGLIGHYLRNELAFELDGGAEPGPKKTLRFDGKISESIEVVTVDYNTGRADSAVLVAKLDWTVKRIGSGETIASGSNMVRAPYDRSSQRFAVVRAARDAQIRAAKSLAQLVKGQLAADLVSG